MMKSEVENLKLEYAKQEVLQRSLDKLIKANHYEAAALLSEDMLELSSKFSAHIDSLMPAEKKGPDPKPAPASEKLQEPAPAIPAQEPPK